MITIRNIYKLQKDGKIMEDEYKKFIQDEKRFLVEALNSHKNRLIKYVDLGYAEVHSKVLYDKAPLELTEKDEKWIKFFKDEIEAMEPFIKRLETIGKLEETLNKQNQ